MSSRLGCHTRVRMVTSLSRWCNVFLMNVLFFSQVWKSQIVNRSKFLRNWIPSVSNNLIYGACFNSRSASHIKIVRLHNFYSSNNVAIYYISVLSPKINFYSIKGHFPRDFGTVMTSSCRIRSNNIVVQNSPIVQQHHLSIFPSKTSYLRIKLQQLMMFRVEISVAKITWASELWSCTVMSELHDQDAKRSRAMLPRVALE